MLVCDAREEDLPAIEALEQRCFSIPWTREMLLYQLTDPGHFFLAARDGDTVAGYIGVQHVLDEGYVTNVCTAPEYRRRGVGRALLEAALARVLGLIHGLIRLAQEAFRIGIDQGIEHGTYAGRDLGRAA